MRVRVSISLSGLATLAMLCVAVAVVWALFDVAFFADVR